MALTLLRLARDRPGAEHGAVTGPGRALGRAVAARHDDRRPALVNL